MVKVLNGTGGISPDCIIGGIYINCDIGCPAPNIACGTCPLDGGPDIINCGCNCDTGQICYTDYCVTDCGSSGGVQRIVK